MSKANKASMIFVGILFFLPLFNTAHAQQSLEKTDCFQYYDFGSVYTKLKPSNVTVFSGSPETFSGTINNDNGYPVLDGMVFVKIFRRSDVSANYNMIVDQFVVKQGIDMAASSSLPISFVWNVPAYAVSGDYYAVTYFISEKEFNMSGLSFTDDISGMITDFSVSGQNSSIIEFDKANVTVDGNIFSFSSFIPQLDKDKPIVIEAPIVNTLKTAEKIPITYSLYQWDGINEARLISTSQEVMMLNPGETKKASYTVKDTQFPVYYVVIEAKFRDTSSIINVRFGRDGVDRPRIGFAGVDSYPLTDMSTVFACVYNSGQSSEVSGDSVSVTLSDPAGNELYKGQYDGPISNAVMGLQNILTGINAKLTDFTLKVVLSNGDKVIDQATLNYSCDTIDSSLCAKKPLTAMTIAGIEVGTETYWLLIGSLIFVALLIIVVIVLVIRKKGKSGVDHHLLIALLVFSGIVGSSYLPEVDQARAIDTSISIGRNSPSVSGASILGQIIKMSSSVGISYASLYPASFNLNSGGSFGMNLNFLFQYGVKISVEPAGASTFTQVANNASVNVGDKVKIEPRGGGYDSKDISGSWFGSGGAYDSPYIHWGSSVPSCPSTDFLTKVNGHTIYLYMPVVAQIPAFSTVPSGGATVAAVSSLGNNTYQVNSAGSLVFGATFGTTQAVPHVQYMWKDSCYQGPVGSGKVNVPSQSFTVNMTAVQPPADNTAPTDLTVDGLTDCIVKNTPVTISLSSADAQGDNVRYSVTKSGSTVNYPSDSAYTPSGTSYVLPVMEFMNGTYSLSFTAQDIYGATSAPVNESVTVKDSCSDDVVTPGGDTPGDVPPGVVPPGVVPPGDINATGGSLSPNKCARPANTTGLCGGSSFVHGVPVTTVNNGSCLPNIKGAPIPACQFQCLEKYTSTGTTCEISSSSIKEI
jgi:hypothetical protein